ncbi:hypothetical protein M752DRAFT_278032 [Aspergillus phoenicis ATCC 13157]|uniref:BZIP domain-containing protein n=1 Tax=Aspergillus phoenicis ATCC 13157 TaxID=1353007 RepID=A0A370PBE8_ASPPH|nr:hypothetical protein M752DRAFT_278032 [Aspergillus phoenicis ATCC 13157]
MEDNLHGIIDIKDRRRIQNRLSQRKRRERLKQKDNDKHSRGLGCPDGRASSTLSSRAPSELDQVIVGGPEMSMDTTTVPELLEDCVLFPDEQFTEPVMSLTADGALLDSTQADLSNYHRPSRRDVSGPERILRPNNSAGEQCFWKETNKSARSAHRHVDPDERPLSILKWKADRIIDQVLSMYQFSVQLEIVEEDPAIVDIMERVRARFQRLRPFHLSVEEE